MLATLYRDRNLEVVCKPPGLAVTPLPGSPPCVEMLTGGRAVHRLDVETSGLVVVAHSDAGVARAGQLFAERRVEKRYAAIGTLRPGSSLASSGTCTVPLGDWRRGRVQVGAGKPASTDWEVRWTEGGRRGVVAAPTTGRTHQIRAHLGTLGLPLDGDEAYGGVPGARLCLHAWAVRFPWPDAPGGRVEVCAPLPDLFGDPARWGDPWRDAG